MSFIEPNDLNDNTANDLNNDAYHNINIGTEEDSDTDKVDSHRISHTETDADNNLSLESDTFNVINNGYLAGKEKIETIF
jgi:hypothetical protein